MSNLKLAAAVAFALLGGAISVWAAKGGVDVVKEPTNVPAAAGSTTQPAGPLDFSMKSIDGADVNLSDYRGKVVMFVNVASKCGYTPQYAALEKLYETYKDKGFVIIGFPANNFGGQEPGTNEEIKTFCSRKYDVTFPMMSKISVKGDDQAPLYKFLTDKSTNGDFGGDIGWNFTKFLIDRNGNVFARFASATKPDAPTVTDSIEKAIAAK